ncbi:triose-phosphate isomerase [Candidatus Peregrinibacteria bacterium]|nr:triose-phosphate isomerase [Candidatus Peregrinibacteria bacterium]
MDFALPLVIVNFKAYPESTGVNAQSLAKDIERLANEVNVNLAIAVQAVDLALIAASVSIPVLAQHVDGVGYGAYTGQVPVDILKPLGVDGALLNHSERRVSDDQIAAAVAQMKKVGMFSVVCAESVEECEYLSKFQPDLIAIEPPELIGGEVSVSTAKPHVISDAVKILGKGKVLVGAGIKNANDVKIAMELGACGILVASGVVRAPRPMDVLRDLCGAFK